MSGGNLPAATVIDVETTGFSNYDRVIEIALISLAPGTWEIIDEYDTLINPNRDVGPTYVHGIFPTMVELAPVFDEVVAAIGRRLQNQVLIAHNLPFDTRMLKNEFNRSKAMIDFGQGLCTLRKTRKKLCVACEDHEIDLVHDHRALADARATAQLAQRLWRDEHPGESVSISIGHVPHPPKQHTLRRGLADEGTSALHRIVSHTHYPHGDEAVLQYLDALDYVLDDGIISEQEKLALKELAGELGISEQVRNEKHNEYLEHLIEAASRDSFITEHETKVINQVAKQLGVMEDSIPNASVRPAMPELAPGCRVCFTGTAMVNGKLIERQYLEALATGKGLVPVKSVTKTKCDLLVAADPSSSSGKTKQARKYQIPVMSVEEFVADKLFEDVDL